MQERAVYTPKQAAEKLQIREETLRRYIREGKLPAATLGRVKRITREDLAAFLCARGARCCCSCTEGGVDRAA